MPANETMKFRNFLIFLALAQFFASTLSSSSSSSSSVANRSFTIDYSGGTFLKDGVAFHYVGGSVHYWRIPPSYWRDRLQKMADCGLDVVTTYVHWALHEPNPGKFDFEGNLDLVTFIKMAQQVGLSVILRPGPYIDAETDLGGIPSWILQKQSAEKPDIFLRTSDPRFLTPVISWFSRLFPMLRNLVYSQGGPIIMVQVENEYGAYPACDKAYLKSLINLTRTLLSGDVVLFSVDGNRVEDLECSRVEGVYSTIDFGVGVDPDDAFRVMKMFEPKGPLVNTEFYAGWLDYWGDHHHRVSTSILSQRLEQLICKRSGGGGGNNSSAVVANVNFYVFHGGTNFGYVNGADDTPYGYLPVVTSYDYDAPLTEAGDVTEKYDAICKIVSTCRGKPVSPNPPSDASTKRAFGPIGLSYVGNFLDFLDVIAPFGSQTAASPIPMEFTQSPYGFILYSKEVDVGPAVNRFLLSTPGLRDRAYVAYGKEFNSILSRGFPPSLQTFVKIDPGGERRRHLHLLVENQGRVAYGPGMNFDLKGILGAVTVEGKSLQGWTTTPLSIDSVALISQGWSSAGLEREREGGGRRGSASRKAARNMTKFQPGMPSFFHGRFVNSPDQQADTFFLPSNLAKGQLFVNGVNLGRYWPSKGPQQTLYIPRDVIKPGINDVIAFELEPEMENPGPQLVDTPKLDRWG